MSESHFHRPIPADGEALVDEYNAELALLEERGQNTWFTAPWLYAEYAFSTVAPPLSRYSHIVTATSQVLPVSLSLPRWQE
jgi:anti-sigma factor RsiW